MAKMRPMGQGLSGGQDMVVSRVTGVPASLRRLRQITKKQERGAERGVKKSVQFLLKETKKVTPKKSGELRKSGKWSTQGKGFQTRGIVYFGGTGPSAEYAIYVHEDLSKYHAPPTMAKFLQRTAWRTRAQQSLIIKNEIAAST